MDKTNEKITEWLIDYYYSHQTTDSGGTTSFLAACNRYRTTTSMIPNGVSTSLDVGTGPGFFANYCALHPQFTRSVAVDLHISTDFYSLSPFLEYYLTDATDLPFKDDEFELVTCCQMLEHLRNWASFHLTINALRRICSRTLIVSVPFDEGPELQSQHFLSFNQETIDILFPDCEKRVIDFNHPRGLTFKKHIIIRQDL